jgi:hypothetical protein
MTPEEIERWAFKCPLFSHTEKIPPFMCMAIAYRHSDRPQIQQRSGLSKRTVERLCNRISWAGVSMDTASAFASGCCVDLLNQEAALRYVKRTMQAKNPFPGLKGKRRWSFNRNLKRFLEGKSHGTV